MCQRILRILTDDEPFGYLEAEASAVLAEQRATLMDLRWWAHQCHCALCPGNVDAGLENRPRQFRRPRLRFGSEPSQLS